MSGILVQVLVLVALTHGIRALGRLAGPRRCGLVLGLPSTTAVMLAFRGQELGLVEAAGAAESCLLGLVATVTLPMVYARTIGAGWRPPWTPLAGVAGYVAMAAALRCLPPIGAVGCIGAAMLGVLTACYLTGRRPASGGASRWSSASRTRTLALRTAVPAVLVVAIKAIGAVAGAGWAGLFISFPGMSLAVLTTTHLESGPAAASRLARAMPTGNLGMIGFLVAFRFAAPVHGLGWGIVLGYAAAMAALLVIEGLARTAGSPRSPATSRPRPRLAVRFLPRVEPVF